MNAHGRRLERRARARLLLFAFPKGELPINPTTLAQQRRLIKMLMYATTYAYKEIG
jgi:hypothetical protein